MPTSPRHSQSASPADFHGLTKLSCAELEVLTSRGSAEGMGKEREWSLRMLRRITVRVLLKSPLFNENPCVRQRAKIEQPRCVPSENKEWGSLEITVCIEFQTTAE